MNSLDLSSLDITDEEYSYKLLVTKPVSSTIRWNDLSDKIPKKLYKTLFERTFSQERLSAAIQEGLIDTSVIDEITDEEEGEPYVRCTPTKL